MVGWDGTGDEIVDVDGDLVMMMMMMMSVWLGWLDYLIPLYPLFLFIF